MKGGVLTCIEVRVTLVEDIKAIEFEDEHLNEHKKRLRLVRHKKQVFMQKVFLSLRGGFLFFDMMILFES